MDFFIEPHVGAMPIKIGMSQSEVQKLELGSMHSFRRTPSQHTPSDHFTDIGVVVYYKSSGVVEAIEFSEPSNPVFKGISLLNVGVSSVLTLLTSLDSKLAIESDGFTSIALGIGVYIVSPDMESADPGKVLSVIVFERGYYDA
jgi:hypothetical protein